MSPSAADRHPRAHGPADQEVADEPYLTIQRKGIFSLNRPAFEALDRPDWVELLYDPDSRRIAVRKVGSSVDHAYGARKLGSRRGESTFLISGAAFTNYYEIDTSKSVRRSGGIEDGRFVIDLNDPGIEVTSNRNRHRAGEGDVQGHVA